MVRLLLPFVLGLCSLYPTTGQQFARHNVIVNTIYGRVEGKSVPTQSPYFVAGQERRINMFLGVPYARRPEQFQQEHGSDWRRHYRFRKPEPPSWDQVWDATYYRPGCPQMLWYVRETMPNFKDTSEDCLYLNVFAPNKTREIPSNNPPLYPVLVFIHGGGYTMGASQQWPGVILAERNIVVVTLNYRLGALGFLSTGDSNAPGNYGLWDQMYALDFVKRNIRQFRGNPHKITLMGHSTGAACVGLHTTSPRHANLYSQHGGNFQQAIMLSGSDRNEWAFIDQAWIAQSYAVSLARLVGCPTTDNFRLVDCLQQDRSVEEIVNGSASVPMREGVVGNPWAPVVDATVIGADYAFVVDTPRVQREQQRFPHIRILTGMTKDEGSWFIPNLPSLPEGITEVQFDNILREFVEDRGATEISDVLEALKYRYTYWLQPNNITMRRQMATDLMSDYMFGTGINEVLKYHALHNDTFHYVFNYRSYNDYLPSWRGVAHGQDMQYIFGFPYFNETYYDMLGVYPRQKYTYGDNETSELMMSLIGNFTTRGHPTPPGLDKKGFFNITWTPRTKDTFPILMLNNLSDSRMVNDYRENYYGFWREYFPSLTGRTGDTRPKVKALAAEDTPYYTVTWALVPIIGILLIGIVIIIIVYCTASRRDKFMD